MDGAEAWVRWSGAGLLAHVPTIVLPEADRRELNHGQDTSLVSGLRRLRREVFEASTTTPWWCSTPTGPPPSSSW